MRGWSGRRGRKRAEAMVLRSLLVGGLLGAVVLTWGLASLHDPETPEAESEEPARTLEGERQDAEEGVPGRAPVGERVRVEVLNAGGVPGAAAAARDELRRRGFDVVYWGNAESFDREATVVLDRAGRTEWARRVAEGLGAGEVRSEPDPSRLLEVTVLLGSGWDPPPEEGAGEEDEDPEPSGLSRWLRDLSS